jgi:hypothetical protein
VLETVLSPSVEEAMPPTLVATVLPASVPPPKLLDAVSLEFDIPPMLLTSVPPAMVPPAPVALVLPLSLEALPSLVDPFVVLVPGPVVPASPVEAADDPLTDPPSVPGEAVDAVVSRPDPPSDVGFASEQPPRTMPRVRAPTPRTPVVSLGNLGSING